MSPAQRAHPWFPPTPTYNYTALLYFLYSIYPRRQWYFPFTDLFAYFFSLESRLRESRYRTPLAYPCSGPLLMCHEPPQNSAALNNVVLFLMVLSVDLDQLSGSCLGSLWGQMVAEAAVMGKPDGDRRPQWLPGIWSWLLAESLVGGVHRSTRM